MKYVLVDVDTQNAFASTSGNLSVYKDGLTNVVLQNIVSLVRKAEETGTPIIGSVDSHSYDAWEFAENGGPFPAHAVKGTSDWLKIPGTLPKRFRFVPMSKEGQLMVGESKQGESNRVYSFRSFYTEALKGVGLYFEKEVYSLFSNPNSGDFIAGLRDRMVAENENNVTFIVVGFCTGGFCCDQAALGLKEEGYNVAVVSDATQAIDGVNAPDGAAYSFDIFRQNGIDVIDTATALSYFR